MTTPARAIDAKDGTRVYPWPSVEPYEFVARSVTTLKEGGIPMQLHYWSAEQAAQYAVDNVESWQGLDREDAVRMISDAPWRYRDGKGAIGDQAHDLIAGYTLAQIDGVPFVQPDPAMVLPEAMGCFQAFLAFETKWNPIWTHSEITVYSRRYNYAGSLDNIAQLDFGDGRGPVPTVVDYKTAKRIYLDVLFQLVAYAKADFYAKAVGDHNEYPLPDVQDGLCVRLGADGKYTALPFSLTAEAFTTFRAAQVVACRDDVIKAAKRKALNSRPRRGDVARVV